MDWGFAVVDANCYMNGLTRSYCIEKGNGTKNYTLLFSINVFSVIFYFRFFHT